MEFLLFLGWKRFQTQAISAVKLSYFIVSWLICLLFVKTKFELLFFFNFYFSWHSSLGSRVSLSTSPICPPRHLWIFFKKRSFIHLIVTMTRTVPGQSLEPGAPFRSPTCVMRPKCLGYLPGCVIRELRFGSRTARIWTDTHIGCQHYRQQFKPVQHNTSPPL